MSDKKVHLLQNNVEEGNIYKKSQSGNLRSINGTLTTANMLLTDENKKSLLTTGELISFFSIFRTDPATSLNHQIPQMNYTESSLRV